MKFTPGTPCYAEGRGKPSVSIGLCSSHKHRMQRYGDPAGGSYYNGAGVAFIESLTDATDDCIIWPFSINPNGYGALKADGVSGAHAYSCHFHNGPKLYPDLEAGHYCGNRSCVNPRHLRWVTPKQNAADKFIHGTQILGEKQHASKLTATAVNEIRSLRSTLTLREIAGMYGVSISTISKICRKESWSWL